MAHFRRPGPATGVWSQLHQAGPIDTRRSPPRAGTRRSAVRCDAADRRSQDWRGTIPIWQRAAQAGASVNRPGPSSTALSPLPRMTSADRTAVDRGRDQRDRLRQVSYARRRSLEQSSGWSRLAATPCTWPTNGWKSACRSRTAHRKATHRIRLNSGPAATMAKLVDALAVEGLVERPGHQPTLVQHPHIAAQRNPAIALSTIAPDTAENRAAEADRKRSALRRRATQ